MTISRMVKFYLGTYTAACVKTFNTDAEVLIHREIYYGKQRTKIW